MMSEKRNGNCTSKKGNRHSETVATTETNTNTATSEDENPKSNPTVIHFNALVPNGHISDNHIEKMMGFQAYDKTQTRERLLRQKQEVRAWASVGIKKVILRNAQELKGTDRIAAIQVDGQGPKEIKDIHRWWDNLNPDDDEEMAKARRSLFFIFYHVFELDKGFELKLEKRFLDEFNWIYDETSKNEAMHQNQRVGYHLKGCIAKNISHVKYEIVKAFQKRCRGSGDGTYVKKARHKEDAYDEENKYIKRKKNSLIWSRMPVEKDNKIDHDGSSDEAEETDHEEGSDVDEEMKLHTEDDTPQSKDSSTYVHVPGSYEVAVQKKREMNEEHMRALFPDEANLKQVRLSFSLILTILFVSYIDLTYISSFYIFQKATNNKNTVRIFSSLFLWQIKNSQLLSHNAVPLFSPPTHLRKQRKRLKIPWYVPFLQCS
jgi:hypothetical protein